MAKEYSYGICPYLMISGNYYVLLNKTSQNSDYNFFKGKIENQETIKECAIREFSEEAGVTVKEEDLEDYFYQKSPRKNIGIFLVDWSKYYSYKLKFQKREIWSSYWVQLIKEIRIYNENGLRNIITSKNQQEIMNSITELFKGKENEYKS